VRCEIHVQGRLAPDVSAGFEEFAIAEAPSQTVVVGEVEDSDALARLLAHAEALGLTVLSLRAVPP
jgi:hypothetical protein